ncbi:MAG: hypothetical protein LBU37_14925 [Tannerellaceae bacterium]|jgi:predicted histone-like DNA-binding protein|nr:hypothetical protein [Tannerellaceae bacterium]
MALKFKKVARKVIGGGAKGTAKYYAVAKSAGVSGADKICKLISARSTVSPADVKAVSDSLAWAMDMEFSSGNVAQPGEPGNFRLSVSSEGMSTKDEANASRIKKARIIFSTSRREPSCAICGKTSRSKHRTWKRKKKSATVTMWSDSHAND